MSGGELKKLLENLPHPEHLSDTLLARIRSVLEADDQSQLGLLSALSGEDAQVALDALWTLFEHPSLLETINRGKSSSRRSKLRRTMIKLYLARNKLPQGTLLEGVRCTDMETRFSGTLGDIYQGKSLEKDVALKRLRVYLMFSGPPKELLKQEFYREALVWKTLSHEHVLPLLGITEEAFQHAICMVLPWIENGSVLQHIESLRSRNELPEDKYAVTVNNWLRQTASALAYLHKEDIVHGDLRGSNILIDTNGNVQLTDFGMYMISEAVSQNYASMQSSAVRWQAPELLDPESFGMKSSRPTCASDVYAFACTCIELYTLRKPFSEFTDFQAIQQIVKGTRPARPSPPSHVAMSEDMWSLVSRCWTPQPSRRPTAEAVAKLMGSIVHRSQTVVVDSGSKDIIAGEARCEDSTPQPPVTSSSGILRWCSAKVRLVPVLRWFWGSQKAKTTR